MFNWVGRFSFILILFNGVFALGEDPSLYPRLSSSAGWTKFENSFKQKVDQDAEMGVSYMISGTFALLGGLVGAASTSDPIEQTAYAVVQTIGIASIGYGAHMGVGGGAEYALYNSLKNTALSNQQRSGVIRSYNMYNTEVEQKERLIRMITHGLVAGLNFYNGSRQENASTRSALFFIGGVNTLAAVSFTF
ncbi:MAG: hypothetical protein AB7O96_08850 [Pseudobdellovibrionaceae bacterium]